MSDGRAHKAGFDIIELHGANGYLLCEFLSPATNKLKSGFGGSLENRMAFPLMVVRAIKQALPPDVPLGFRLLLNEWVPNGIQLQESIVFAKGLEAAGIAYLSAAAGTFNSIFRPSIAKRMARTGYLRQEMAANNSLWVVQPFCPTGVPLLDVKGRIEALIMSAGIPFSSLRTGCYMDIWLAFFPTFMKLGLYLLPVSPDHRFSFTSQRDVARAAALLIRRNKVLNGPLDVIEPRARTLREVIDLYRTATGRRLWPLGRWLLPILKLLKPTFFRWLFPSGVSRVSLFSYFNEKDWVGDPSSLSKLLPDFQATSMEDYIRQR